MTADEFLKLPIEIQLVMAAGYLGYRTATTGLDRNHKTADIIFQVFVYGLITYISYDVTSHYLSKYASMAAGFGGAIGIASIWRTYGRRVFVWILRKTKTTRENFSPTTWDHILQSSQKWNYVSVVCDDDVAYESNLASLPKGLPFEPLDTDPDGNVAIYVTRTIPTSGDPIDHNDGALDSLGRAHLTYIPASRIKNITVSFQTNLATSEASLTPAVDC